MKTEKEKMLIGEYYNSWDEELIIERERATNLLFELQQLTPSDQVARTKLFEELFGSIGKNSVIKSPFTCDYGYNITVGDNLFMNSNCTILDGAKVTIGDDVLIGPNVSFYTPNHAFDAKERKAGLEQSLPITIGDNVWISGSVTITPGVTIGNNTVIGAGSVVTKDIPDNVLAVGVPCKVIRLITPEDKIK